MTLRPEYSLGHSEYNAFLFAAVGEEKVGLPLTVLTALTRLGFDPWREAARLSDLPRETASRAFAVTIAMLPEGDWKASVRGATTSRGPYGAMIGAKIAIAVKIPTSTNPTRALGLRRSRLQASCQRPCGASWRMRRPSNSATDISST